MHIRVVLLFLALLLLTPTFAVAEKKNTFYLKLELPVGPAERMRVLLLQGTAVVVDQDEMEKLVRKLRDKYQGSQNGDGDTTFPHSIYIAKSNPKKKIFLFVTSAGQALRAPTLFVPSKRLTGGLEVHYRYWDGLNVGLINTTVQIVQSKIPYNLKFFYFDKIRQVGPAVDTKAKNVSAAIKYYDLLASLIGEALNKQSQIPSRHYFYPIVLRNSKYYPKIPLLKRVDLFLKYAIHVKEHGNLRRRLNTAVAKSFRVYSGDELTNDSCFDKNIETRGGDANVLNYFQLSLCYAKDNLYDYFKALNGKFDTGSATKRALQYLANALLLESQLLYERRNYLNTTEINRENFSKFEKVLRQYQGLRLIRRNTRKALWVHVSSILQYTDGYLLTTKQYVAACKGRAWHNTENDNQCVALWEDYSELHKFYRDILMSNDNQFGQKSRFGRAQDVLKKLGLFANGPTVRLQHPAAPGN